MSRPANPVTLPLADYSPKHFLLAVVDGVATVTLNRPERMNAWGGGLAAAFYRCMDLAEADPAVRVIVLTGNGRAFCAGADMGDGDTIGGASVGGDTDVTALVGERHPHFVTGMRKPIIAAINGACAGIGLTQALMCDIRFAAAGAKFTTAFSRRGLIAEYGIRTPGPDAPIGSLSGGNVQRAVLARELGGDVEVLIAANPCFGLDFAAVAQIHAEIMAARNRGAAVLLVSEDLDELLELSDRLVVMFHGQFVYEARASEADLTEIGRHMAGH